MKEKTKVWEYHISHSFVTKKGEKCSFNTQLYSVGIYGILNNNPGMQGNFKPKDIVKMEKVLNKSLVKGEITNLEFDTLIKVKETESGYIQI